MGAELNFREEKERKRKGELAEEHIASFPAMHV
jgi:hypothetical protein